MQRNPIMRPIRSRREFIQAAAIGFPSIVPASVFGQFAPSKRINVGQIGAGRIARVHDLPGVLQYDNARVVAICWPFAEPTPAPLRIIIRSLRSQKGDSSV
jgi:hypothetical protein